MAVNKQELNLSCFECGQKLKDSFVSYSRNSNCGNCERCGNFRSFTKVSQVFQISEAIRE